MDQNVEALKQIDLVQFLSQYYDLQFRRSGAAFACRSPFTEESSNRFRLDDDERLFPALPGSGQEKPEESVQLPEFRPPVSSI